MVTVRAVRILLECILVIVCFKDDSSEEDESSEEEEKPELLGRGRRTAVLEARTRVCTAWVRVLETRNRVGAYCVWEG